MHHTSDLSPFSDPVSETVLPACGVVLTDVCLLPVGEKHDVSVVITYLQRGFLAG